MQIHTYIYVISSFVDSKAMSGTWRKCILGHRPPKHRSEYWTWLYVYVLALKSDQMPNIICSTFWRVLFAIILNPRHWPSPLFNSQLFKLNLQTHHSPILPCIKLENWFDHESIRLIHDILDLRTMRIQQNIKASKLYGSFWS